MALSPRQQIAAIDKQINDLRRRVPDINQRRDQETELFRARGFAQLDRDLQYEQASVASFRRASRPRLKKCPTCGHKSAVAA